MKFLMLAAGTGSRMGSLTKDYPKALLPLKDSHSIFSIQMQLAKKHKIEKRAVVGGHGCHLFRTTEETVFENKEYKISNMVWSLLAAERFLDDDIIISYGDIIYTEHLLSELIISKDPFVITSDSNWLETWTRRVDDPLSDLETFQIGNEGYLSDLGRKPRYLHEIEGQYMGLFKIDRVMLRYVIKIIKELRKEFGDSFVRTMYMTDLLQHLIEKNVQISILHTTETWVEIDNPRDLEYAQSRIGYFLDI